MHVAWDNVNDPAAIEAEMPRAPLIFTAASPVISNLFTAAPGYAERSR